MQDTIGKRIANLRQEMGWTQQYLADRAAISRVSISHIEMDLTIPGERTITLIAGLFKLTPHALVRGTDYPLAKAERLPIIACSYTQLEMDLAVLENDLEWLKKIADQKTIRRMRSELWEKWNPTLEMWIEECIDPEMEDKLDVVTDKLWEACHLQVDI